MLFYKAEGTLANTSDENENGRRVQRDNIRNISMKSSKFNEKHCRNSFYFVSNSSEDNLIVGILTNQMNDVEVKLNSYLKYIGCELKGIVITEITMNAIQNLLCSAKHQNFISNDNEILESFGLNELGDRFGRRGRGFDFRENIIDDRSKKEVFSNAKKYLLDNTFLPELNRIYTNPTTVNHCGHPVHYMLKIGDRDTSREAYNTLLQALYANNRLKSRRYSVIDFKPDESFFVVANALFKACSGGAVVVRYLVNDGPADSGLCRIERDAIETLCEVIKRNRKQVLTIICFPRECKKAKASFQENLGSMLFLEIEEDLVNCEQASLLLKRLARENHIRTDKALFAKLEDDKDYFTPELRAIFDDWYDNKLKATIYPQYKEFNRPKPEIVKSASRRTAYDELQQMIGLKQAKSVIQKALNYYKMQKLYEEKGLKSDIPAMHMVFSGNSGTAKTTVARLFARIMKDNGLLSKGQFLEVGRGDLVGRYVGWTAQTVQSKFRESVGGVLFIDEAYSLVDDCSGSYGDEAINTIVQEMENHREDVVVIFAGYPDKMDEFLQKNPGLRSRIAFHVPFADYDTKELCDIASLTAKNKGFIFESEALEKLFNAFEIARKQSDFGNGRYVRNIIEQARMNQASRLLEYDFDKITTEEITTIKAVDIDVPNIKIEQNRTIGFAC